MYVGGERCDEQQIRLFQRDRDAVCCSEEVLMKLRVKTNE